MQPTVNMFLQFLHSIFALFVCKRCSESAVGFVHSEKPALPLQILAVHPWTTLLISTVEVQVFTVSQIPLQFQCIFYRQTMQILNLKTAKKYLQWVVCKKWSETAVGFVTK